MALIDLPDDRRSAKPWLPQDGGLDVSSGLVIGDLALSAPQCFGHPRCRKHGAMHRIDPVERLYRCSECGVGARWEPDEAVGGRRSPREHWSDAGPIAAGTSFSGDESTARMAFPD